MPEHFTLLTFIIFI